MDPPTTIQSLQLEILGIKEQNEHLESQLNEKNTIVSTLQADFQTKKGGPCVFYTQSKHPRM